MLKCLQFDKFFLCPTEKLVNYGEIKLDIRGKDFEVLHLLLRHPKRLVRKEDFLQEVWRGVTVEESNIAVCIKSIRRNLGVYSKVALIETVWGEGYRLLVDVVEVNTEVRNFDIQSENNSITPWGEHHKNKANELQAQQFSAAINKSRKVTDRVWDVIRISTITLSLIFLCIGAITHLASPVNTFSIKPFLPGSFFLVIYIVIEIVRELQNYRNAISNAQKQKEIAKAEIHKTLLELNEKCELEKTRADQAEEAYQTLSEDFKHRLVYRASKLEIKINIYSYYGDCHCRFIWTDISKVRPDANIFHIPGSIRFSPSECSFKQYPALTSNYEKEYQIQIVTKDANSCEFYVNSTEPRDNMSYEYTADAYSAFYLAEEELVGQQYDHEWFGYRVISMIETLVIKVSFPDYYKPTHIQPDAHLGFFKSRYSDNTEVERIHKEHGFNTGSDGEITLTVNRPKVGHYYSLRWKPMPMELVEPMRQMQQHQV